MENNGHFKKKNWQQGDLRCMIFMTLKFIIHNLKFVIRKLYVNNLARRSGVLSLPPSLVRTPCSMTMIMVRVVLMIKTIMVIKTMMIRNNDHLTFPLRHKLKRPTDPLPSAWQRLLAHLLTSHQKRKVALKGFLSF